MPEKSAAGLHDGLAPQAACRQEDNTVMTEHEILSIDDDADRADAVAAFLDRQQPSHRFLNALIKDRYDVIRAEALDCAIVGGISLDRVTLAELAMKEAEPIVRGRLKLYLMLFSFVEEAALIEGRGFQDAGSRDEPWEQACRYFAHRDGESFLAFSRLLFADDYGVAETSLDLMLLLSIGMHRKMLKALLEAAAYLSELRISKARLDAARQMLATESPPASNMAEIRAQLS